MLVDGRALAQKILANLKKEIRKLKNKPHLAVILVGEDPVWKVYVGQKLKKGEEIGAKVTIKNYESGISNKELIRRIKKLNRDSHIHGIIIQRPLPPQLDKEQLALAVDPQKDVDGFHPKSYYPMPVAAAVMEILKNIYQVPPRQGATSFSEWLKAQDIVVIGKGETAGGPTITALKKLGTTPKVIDSQTHNPGLITKQADIIISCAGKADMVRPEMIKKEVILISVGLHRNAQGKLVGDYDQEAIKDIASFYTPIPGGVGPVNVSMLLDNLVSAAKKSQNN